MHMQTLCFHTGMTEAFVWDQGSAVARRTGREETEQILSEIHNQIVRDNRKWIYSHKVSISEAESETTSMYTYSGASV